MTTLINDLQQARKAKKLSQAEMSKLLNLPQSHLSNIENGKTDLRLSNLENIAHLLGLELMLVPKAMAPYVRATLAGKDLSQTPRWLPDEVDDEQA